MDEPVETLKLVVAEPHVLGADELRLLGLLDKLGSMLQHAVGLVGRVPALLPHSE